MKNQYVGDIGDYGKYGLLRFLANHGIRIGINWYLTENDRSNDGIFISYLNQPSNRCCDPELFDTLKEIAPRSDKNVQMIENAGIISNAGYYSAVLKNSGSDSKAKKINRRLWYNNSNLFLNDAELIFADPDNGISYRKTAANKDSEKYVLPEEIVEYYHSGKDVVFYCHKGRRKQEDWEESKTGIRKWIRDAQILAVTFHRGTQRSYIFVLHPDSYRRYERILSDFLSTEWNSMFTWESIEGNVSVRSHSLNKVSGISLEPLDLLFSVCKVTDYTEIDIERPFVFTGRTELEKSLVCPTSIVPQNTTDREDGWRAFRVCGKMDFSLVGILSGITGILAEGGVSVFAISTYDTDYVLVKDEEFEKALMKLNNVGYSIVNYEEHFIAMPEENYSRRAQIPIRLSRFNYLLNQYVPSKNQTWIMFQHPGHFFIYDKKSRYCIFDGIYLKFEKETEDLLEDDPIVAVITEIIINQDPNQYPDLTRDSFSLFVNLITNDI